MRVRCVIRLTRSCCGKGLAAASLILKTLDANSYSKMSIKHVCDWAMMRQAFKDTLDWNEFDKQCIRFGLKNFVDCLNHLADYILGKCSHKDLLPIDKRVLDDTFKKVTLSKNLMKQRIEKSIGVLRSSWKVKHFCSDSMIKELSHSVWAYLREDKPELD